MEITGLYIDVIISIISLLPLAAGVEEPSIVGLHMTCTPFDPSTCTLTEGDGHSCHPGYSRDCSQESSARRCCPCPAGSYMDKDNHCLHCIAYTDCSGRMVKFNGSHSMDRKCGDLINTTAEQDWPKGTTLPPSSPTTQSTLPPSSTTNSNSTTKLPQITDKTTTPSSIPLMDDVTTEGAIAGNHGEVSVTPYMAVILVQVVIIIFLIMFIFRGNILGMAAMLGERMSSFWNHRSETKDPLPGDAGIPLRPQQDPRNEELPERPADNGQDT